MKPRVIAHRGDSASRPENTLAAFQGALEAGAELLECDVQLSRDGEVVVIHDPSVDRTTNGRGRVDGLSLRELRALSAGYPERFGGDYAGERIPTLAEVLAFVRGRARLMVEIKHDAVGEDALDGIEARTLQAVRQAGMLAEVALISFDTRALRRCREQEPDMLRGLLYVRGEPLEIVAGAQAAGAGVLLPEKSALSPELQELCRRANLRLATWVVDDPAELPALARYELYGIGSNRPGALIEALAG